jgi:3-oxoacyl-[acyl-carrier-protein] synthase II
MDNVVIVGMGAIAPKADSAPELWRVLLSGKHTFEYYSGQYQISRTPALVGRITSDSHIRAVKRLHYCNLPPAVNISHLYLLSATSEAMTQAGFLGNEGSMGRVAVIIGNLEANGRIFRVNEQVEQEGSIGDYQVANSDELWRSLKVILPRIDIGLTVHNTCASANAALEIGTSLIQDGIVDTAVVGASEAFSDRILAGFQSLGVVGGEPCRPFSKKRKFVTISEGSAVFLLQRSKGEKTAPLARVLGVSSSSDAKHPTNPDPSGIRLCVQKAYDIAGISGNDIDCIYAHGTGSRANDHVEANIFMEQNSRSVISAIKGSIGHAMGAAGAMGLVSSIQTLATGIVSPTTTPSEDLEYNIRVSQKPEMLQGSRLMVQNNAFGFGGLNTVSVLSRP